MKNNRIFSKLTITLIGFATLMAFSNVDPSINGIKLSTETNTSTPKVTVVSTNGRLMVKGTKIVNKYNETIQLKGISYPWHNWWPRYFNASSVNTFVTKWGCNVIRVSMGVDEDNNCYLKSPVTSERYLTTVIDAAINEGVYVLIDWHSHHNHTSEAVTFFDKISKKYTGKPNVFYEIYNEPLDTAKWENVKAYSLKVIEAIRKNDKEGIIIVGSPFWSTALEKVAADPITGYSNIVYTYHFYAKTIITQQKCIRAIKDGLPIFVSECGGQDYTGAGALDINSWNNWVKWMKDNSVSWCAWTIPSFINEDEASSTGPWPDDIMTDWGKIVRNGIQEK